MSDNKPVAPERIHIVPNLHEPGTFYREWITDAGNSPRRQSVSYILASSVEAQLAEAKAELQLERDAKNSIREAVENQKDELASLRATHATELEQVRREGWQRAIEMVHAIYHTDRETLIKALMCARDQSSKESDSDESDSDEQ